MHKIWEGQTTIKGALQIVLDLSKLQILNFALFNTLKKLGKGLAKFPSQHLEHLSTLLMHVFLKIF